MRKKPKGRNPKQEKKWMQNHLKILKTVKKIEKNKEKALFSKIRKQLIEDARSKKDKLSDPTISKHLSKAMDNGQLYKIGKVYYTRPRMRARAVYEEMLVLEILSGIPLLEDKEFEEFVSRLMPRANKLEQEYEKKSKRRLIGVLSRPKLQDIRLQKQRVLANIRKRAREDFDYLEKATDLEVWASKRLQYLDTRKIAKVFADILYKVLRRERDLAQARGQKFSLEDFGLVVTMRFAPHRTGEPPSPPSLLDQIELHEKASTTRFSEGLLERLKQREVERLEGVTRFEEEADKINILGWNVECPHYVGYLADHMGDDEAPKCMHSSRCPKLLECIS